MRLVTEKYFPCRMENSYSLSTAHKNILATTRPLFIRPQSHCCTAGTRCAPSQRSVLSNFHHVQTHFTGPSEWTLFHQTWHAARALSTREPMLATIPQINHRLWCVSGDLARFYLHQTIQFNVVFAKRGLNNVISLLLLPVPSSNLTQASQSHAPYNRRPQFSSRERSDCQTHRSREIVIVFLEGDSFPLQKCFYNI